MKISKVNHRRTAVAEKKTVAEEENIKIHGVLYKTPTPKDGSNSLDSVETRVEEAIESAQRLYNPFNRTKIKSQGGISINAVKNFRNINKNFSNFIKYHIQDLEINNKNCPQKVEISVDMKKNIEKLCDQSVRKSLVREVKGSDGKKYDLQTIIKKVVLIYFCSFTSECELKPVTPEEMHALMSAIYEDYNKENQKKNIIHSFENQKTKVENVLKAGDLVVEDGKYLKLGIANSEKKQFLWEFLLTYAEGTKQEQSKILYEIQKLIVLYICGSDAYKEIKDDVPENIWQNPAWKNITDEQKFLNLESCEKQEKKHDDGTTYVQYIISAKDIRNANMDHFHKALGCRKDERNWFGYFSHVLETLFNKDNKRKPERLDCQYLCKYIYNTFCSYIACKYIDLGKGVYHFTMGDLDKNLKNEETSFGKLDAKFCDGITSFDYEEIKAKETFERDLATYVNFSTNVFAKAAILDEYSYDNTDILQYRKKGIFEDENVVKPDALQNVLQFYGGQSRWYSEIAEIKQNDLLQSIREHLENIRNGSVHYTTDIQEKTRTDKKSLADIFFNKDYSECAKLIAGKYYSNNAWMFYEPDKLAKMMNILYGTELVREAQIPAFNNIIKKNNLAKFIEESGFFDKKYVDAVCKDTEIASKYRASLYFMLKETYYYGFLREKDLANKFVEYVNKEYNHSNNDKSEHAQAENDFWTRINELCPEKNSKDITFGELCQAIMTDYNQQNQNRKKIRTNEQQKKDKENGSAETYRHFPLILHSTISQLFKDYLVSKSAYDFLKKPEIQPEIAKESFEEEICKSFNQGLYSSLKSKVDAKNSNLLDWYVMAHFLTPKHLNHLIGDIKNYVQFVGDIEKRAAGVGIAICNHFSSASDLQKTYKDVLCMLEFSQQYVGRVSSEITDYFANEAEYVEYISKFVEFNKGEQDSNADMVTMLKKFCNNTVSRKSDERIGIYYDGENPILNRNIAYAKMYGEEKILGNCFADDRISLKEIQEKYYGEREKLNTVMETGICTSEADQRRLKRYQIKKNRIELFDVSVFTDIINDFMAQMVSWAYLRERDLMYFQLGIHYLRLFDSEKLKQQGDYGKGGKYRCLNGEKIHITDGAILYQLAAINKHNLTVYMVDAAGNAVKPEGNQTSIGACINRFVSDYCNGIEETYECGLQVFENLSQHKELSDFRNNIAHMRYMAVQDKSILEMMWTLYSSFFKYDTKLKKSMTYIFQNILMRYQVASVLSLHHRDQTGNETGEFAIKNLISDKFTYKVKEEEIDVKVRSVDFLIEVAKVLTYPNDVTEELKNNIRNSVNTSANKSTSTNNNNGGKKNGQKFTKSKKKK